MNNLLVRDIKYQDEQYRIGEGIISDDAFKQLEKLFICLLYTSPSQRDRTRYRITSSA